MKEKKLNRTQRRALEYAKMQERQRQKIRHESKPTGEPLLDSGLALLTQATSVLKTLGWTSDEIHDRVKVYMELEARAEEEMKAITTEDRLLYQATLDGTVHALRIERYQNDLADSKVKQTVEFLKSEEGKALNAAWGF